MFRLGPESKLVQPLSIWCSILVQLPRVLELWHHVGHALSSYHQIKSTKQVGIKPRKRCLTMASDSGSACLCSLCCKLSRFSMVFRGMLPKDNTNLQTHADMEKDLFSILPFLSFYPSLPPFIDPSGHVLVGVELCSIELSMNPPTYPKALSSLPISLSWKSPKWNVKSRTRVHHKVLPDHVT